MVSRLEICLNLNIILERCLIFNIICSLKSLTNLEIFYTLTLKLTRIKESQSKQTIKVDMNSCC